MNSHLFRVICILHSVIALTSGTLMMFYTEKASIFGHGSDIANKLKGSTPHDELLIQISQSFSGLLLFAIGLVLFMVSFVKDREFHGFFAGGSVILYVLMALWRVVFEWKVEDLAFECPKQALGDIALAVSWVFFLVYTWREKGIVNENKVLVTISVVNNLLVSVMVLWTIITFIGAPFSSCLLCLALKVKAFFCSSLSLVNNIKRHFFQNMGLDHFKPKPRRRVHNSIFDALVNLWCGYLHIQKSKILNRWLYFSIFVHLFKSPPSSPSLKVSSFHLFSFDFSSANSFKG
ncbi:unnamed protein product [Brassica rapa subsp. trilocularis]